MTLKDIASVAGKPGLFRIVKPTRNGVILETLDKKKAKSVVNANQRISVLKEISIYTHTEEESVALKDVFITIRENNEGKLTINTSDSEALKGFLEGILPEYDREKVYTSDIKKLVNWYNLLQDQMPELLDNLKNEEESESEGEEKEEVTSEQTSDE